MSYAFRGENTITSIEDFIQQPPPPSPAFGLTRLYASNATGLLTTLNSNGTSTTLGSGGGSGIQATAFGVTANTRWTVDGVTTNNSATVSSATINFTNADVGRTIYTVLPATGLTKLIGTIQSVQNSTTCTCSTLATATQASATLCVGTDDTAALQAAWAQAILVGGTVFLPAGNMLISAQLFFLSGPSAAIPGAAMGVVGQGSKAGGSTFVVSPNFNWAGMQGSGLSKGVIFSYSANALANFFTAFQGGFASGFSVMGLGSVFTGGPSGVSLLYGSNGPEFSEIQIFGFSGPNALSCITLGTETRCYSVNIQPQFGGGPAGAVYCITTVSGSNSIDIYSPILAFTAGWGLEVVTSTDVEIFGGLITSCGNGPGTNPHTCVNIVASIHVGFHGTVIQSGGSGGTTPGNILIDGTSSCFLDDVKLAGGTTGNTSIWVLAGGSLYCSRVNNAVTGSENGINIAGSLYDMGGNNFGQTPTITGSVFGTNSITGVAAATTAVTASTGWGTSGAAGNGISAISGNSKRIQFTVTAAGAPSANPTIVVTWPSAFLVAPIVSIQQVGGTGAQPTSITLGTPTTTSSGTITWNGTPVAASTYIFQISADLP